MGSVSAEENMVVARTAAERNRATVVHSLECKGEALIDEIDALVGPMIERQVIEPTVTVYCPYCKAPIILDLDALSQPPIRVTAVHKTCDCSVEIRPRDRSKQV